MSRRAPRPGGTRERDAAAAPLPAPMGKALERLLVYALPALALFACVWVTRVFVSAEIVAGVLHMTGLPAIAMVAALGGLLPALPLGLAYGVMSPEQVYARALLVALFAALCELGFASLTVPWWSFFTWWVLPLECAVLLVVFPVAAWIGAHLFPHASAVSRRRVGVTTFIVLTLVAIALPWFLH